MILTSYYDESGTHEGSPVTIMAAVLGTVNQWRLFQRELDRLKRNYGFKTFHTKRFKAKAGDFSGWSNEKCLSLIRELAPLTGRSFIHAHVLSISNDEYARDYKTAQTERKLRLDTPYGLCFRVCLRSQVLAAVKELQGHKDFLTTKMNVVLERGHKHSGDALRIFDEEVRDFRAMGLDLLGDVTLADKDTDALMVADFLAHTTFVTGDRSLTDPKPYRVGPPFEETTGLTHLRFDPGGLASMRALLIEKLEARRAFGQRVARPASGGQQS